MNNEELFGKFNIEPDSELLVDEALTNLYDVLDYLSSTRDESDPAYQWLIPIEEKLKKALELRKKEDKEAEELDRIACSAGRCASNVNGYCRRPSHPAINAYGKCVAYRKVNGSATQNAWLQQHPECDPIKILNYKAMWEELTEEFYVDHEYYRATKTCPPPGAAYNMKQLEHLVETMFAIEAKYRKKQKVETTKEYE